MGEMNRDFRTLDRTASVPVPAERGSRGLDAVIREKDEELALFLEMRRRDRQGRDAGGGGVTVEIDGDGIGPQQQLPGPQPAAVYPVFDVPSPSSAPDIAPDDLLHSEDENHKHDYDWLLTPPGTPLFPSLEKNTLKPQKEHDGTQNPPVLKSKVSVFQDPLMRGNSISKQSKAPSGFNSSLEIKRSSLSAPNVVSRVANRPAVNSSKPLGGPGMMPTKPTGSTRISSRSATPTNRSTSVNPKTSKTSAPVCRPSMPSKTVAPPRSSTPSGSATPSSRAYVGQTGLTSSRAPTPTRQISNSSSVPNNSCPPDRSSTSKLTGVTKTSSPSGSSKPLKQSEIPGVSTNGPSSSKTSIPTRPLSASRGRPGIPVSRSLSAEPGPGNRLRRQSCSPARGQSSKGVAYSRSSVPAVSRSAANGNDDINPVLMGNKMVERVIHARRLAPPKLENQSTYNNSSGKSALSSDSTGFGRTLSKTSLDMALRHMDIRGSIPNNLRPLMKTIPTSAMCSVRLGSTKSGVNASDSSLVTSSNGSSDKYQ